VSLRVLRVLLMLQPVLLLFLGLPGLLEDMHRRRHLLFVLQLLLKRGFDAGQLAVPAPNSGFVSIAAGSHHSMGLRSDGSIVLWEQTDITSMLVLLLRFPFPFRMPDKVACPIRTPSSRVSRGTCAQLGPQV